MRKLSSWLETQLYFEKYVAFTKMPKYPIYLAIYSTKLNLEMKWMLYLFFQNFLELRWKIMHVINQNIMVLISISKIFRYVKLKVLLTFFQFCILHCCMLSGHLYFYTSSTYIFETKLKVPYYWLKQEYEFMINSCIKHAIYFIYNSIYCGNSLRAWYTLNILKASCAIHSSYQYFTLHKSLFSYIK